MILCLRKSCSSTVQRTCYYKALAIDDLEWLGGLGRLDGMLDM